MTEASDTHAGTQKEWAVKHHNCVSVLQRAQNVQLHQSQLNAVGGDMYQTIHIGTHATHIHDFDLDLTRGGSLALLRRFSAVEATVDSGKAAYARCKPGTRRVILQNIKSWTIGAKPSTPLLWLSGPAGGGKTCIQREVVELCEEEGIFAASFFFSTRINGLDKSTSFVATIALQLCASIPGYKRLVKRKIRKDGSIFEKSLETQLTELVARPLNRLQTCWSIHRPWVPSSSPLYGSLGMGDTRPKVIIVDGLDECRNPEEQVRLIKLLASALANAPLLFRVIIASRPEYDIRTAFQSDDVQPMVYHIKLQDYDSQADIKSYFADSLLEIRDKHPCAPDIPKSWPSDDDIEKVVQNASGQFVYASTLIAFLRNPRRNLVEMFALAINFPSSPCNSINPFTNLDSLYTLVLESADVELDLLRRLLHGIIALSAPPKLNDGFDKPPLITPAFLDAFYCLPPGTTNATLCDLHSVLHVPHSSESTSILLHHKSLEDYLLSPGRSGRFYRPPYETHAEIVDQSSLHLAQSNLDHNQSSRTLATTYSSIFWPYHAHAMLESGDGVKLTSKISPFLSGSALKYRCIELASPSSTRPSTPHEPKLQDTIHRIMCTQSDSCTALCVQLVQLCQICDHWVDLFGDLFSESTVRKGVFKGIPELPREQLVRRVNQAMALRFTEWQSYCEWLRWHGRWHGSGTIDNFLAFHSPAS
ncbi:hypothetical protein FA15DRAFT_674848 [Coprinopsis marcescibilis]|uniref:Nephrocystin 3-like N-terminal domain-containing protein n=1 Tax=Coprinopsis marcescibilis TaxID=230819 RepID=A0A5C3KG43_COPMA|nr:hypothetical protein FA15DRAFT_674848 [Coprinopsis marcescibilis]